MFIILLRIYVIYSMFVLFNFVCQSESALNLPGTLNTSSEYYMECAARANDGFEKKEIKSKTIFVHKFFLEFCYFLVFEL